jgi:hypothetical protein
MIYIQPLSLSLSLSLSLTHTHTHTHTHTCCVHPLGRLHDDLSRNSVYNHSEYKRILRLKPVLLFTSETKEHLREPGHCPSSEP